MINWIRYSQTYFLHASCVRNGVLSGPFPTLVCSVKKMYAWADIECVWSGPQCFMFKVEFGLYCLQKVWGAQSPCRRRFRAVLCLVCDGAQGRWEVILLLWVYSASFDIVYGSGFAACERGSKLITRKCFLSHPANSYKQEWILSVF